MLIDKWLVVYFLVFAGSFFYDGFDDSFVPAFGS